MIDPLASDPVAEERTRAILRATAVPLTPEEEAAVRRFLAEPDEPVRFVAPPNQQAT